MNALSQIGLFGTWIVFTLGFLVACDSSSKKVTTIFPESQHAATSMPPGEAARRARAILKPVKESFMQNLTAMMAQGTENAISACRVIAPALTQAASTGDVEVGRTSHLLRNPANAPREWVKPFLDEFQEAPRDPESFRVVSLMNGRVGYVEPIYVKTLCLNCHGNALPETVSAKIKSLYPSDKATGFQEGDFRGLFWVEMGK